MKNNRKVIYLSIPISGMPINEVKDKANEYKRTLEVEYLDYDIYTPFDVVGEGNKEYGYCMGKDIEFILQYADLVIFVYDYNESKGCNLEFETAKIYDIPYKILIDEPTLRTENIKVGKKNTEKTNSEAEKKNRIIEYIKRDAAFVCASDILLVNSVQDDVIHVISIMDNDIVISVDTFLDHVISGRYKFVTL